MDATITVRVDLKTKKKAQLILKELGLDLSTAINIYLKHIVKNGGIPFMIEEPNKRLLKEIEDTIDGKGLTEEYNSLDELVKQINDEIAKEDADINR